jgi:peptidoglycan hydrolase-like protein with peptidoglycan-binding domain
MTMRMRALAPSLMAPLALAGALAAALPSPAAAQAALAYSQPLSPSALMQVQDRLRQLGLYSGRIDGVWGPGSQQALERFQQGNGLQVTGQLNHATAATLGLDAGALFPAGSGAGIDASPSAALSGPLGYDAVRHVQRRLRSLGFYRGRADGIWGPGTQASLQRFQQSRGLQPDGQLNPMTAQALGLNPARLDSVQR